MLGSPRRHSRRFSRILVCLHAQLGQGGRGTSSDLLGLAPHKLEHSELEAYPVACQRIEHMVLLITVNKEEEGEDEEEEEERREGGRRRTSETRERGLRVRLEG